METNARSRSSLFISYSHKDARWLREVKTALKPVLRNSTIDLWDDTRIRPGARWKREIEQAIRRAGIAVLLVSQNFLASDFIAENELPPLLEAAQRDGLRVLWIALSASSYSETGIAAFQAANDPAKPLDTLRRARLNAELVHIAGIVSTAANDLDGFEDLHALPIGIISKTQMEQTQVDSQSELQKFINNYGGALSRQSIEAAATDVQLKNIALTLASEIARSKCGTILDIGCGNGVLLQRLSELQAFQSCPEWLYVGADHSEATSEVLKLAIAIKIHRRVDVIPLDTLHTEWLSSQFPSPTIVVIRNVFHELDIPQTSRLLSTLAERVRPNDTVVVQDLQVFPTAERGNACWTFENLTAALKRIGFSATGVEEPTKQGNQWFSVLCRRTESKPLTSAEVTKIVIEERSKQYKLWTRMESLVSRDSRAKQIALLDLDLQLAALQKQLLDANAPEIQPPTADRQKEIASLTFSSHLSSFDVEGLKNHLVPSEPPPSFRDRANSQDDLEKFLRDSTAVALIVGGPFMGKTYLVDNVLSRRAHERQPITIDAQITSSVWNLLEEYLTGVGCTFPYDVVANFRETTFHDIERPLLEFVVRVSRWTIVVFDHFERLLDPKGAVADPEISQFLKHLVQANDSKVILTSRRKPLPHFVEGDFTVAIQSPVGRFPEGKHIENLLDDFIPRAGTNIEYPPALFTAIDRYPYLAALAGRVVRREGVVVLEDPRFLELLKLRLREDLLRRIVTDVARPAVELLSLVRIPIPRSMFVNLAGVKNVEEAEDLGLLYTIRERGGEYLTGVAVLRPHQEELTEIESVPSSAEDTSRDGHGRIADWYLFLYRKSNDPRWVREAHYHLLASGDPSGIRQFGVAYKGELFQAGEYWFRNRRDYKASLEAFEAAKKFGAVSTFLEMRIAGCLMRVGRQEEGERYYNALIEQYDARGIKSSLIDSLLYLRHFKAALDRLQQFEFKINDGAWTAHQYGRAYMGEHLYKEAIQAFEVQLSLKPEPIVYHMLARAYHRAGERGDVGRVLSAGLRRYADDMYLKRDYAAHLLRTGDSDQVAEAERILRALHRESPTNGRVLQQFVRLLCSTGRVDEARELLKGQNWRIDPERYRLPIELTMLIGDRRYEEAITKLADISSSDEHLLGMKKKAYLRWAQDESNWDDRRLIAAKGLSIPMDSALQRNIPIMVTSARLARLAEDNEAFELVVGQIGAVNPDVAELLREESQELVYWDDDALDL